MYREQRQKTHRFAKAVLLLDYYNIITETQAEIGLWKDGVFHVAPKRDLCYANVLTASLRELQAEPASVAPYKSDP